MNSHPFDTLPLPQGGSLIFTPCPGTKGIDLATSVAQLGAAGAAGVITLMTDQEMAHNEVTALPSVCSEHNLKWFHLPVQDDMAPEAEFEQAWSEHKQQINSILDQNGTLAVHCKGGSGRTGLMVAIILLDRGYSFEQVTAMVKGMRPNALKKQPHIDYLAQKNESTH